MPWDRRTLDQEQSEVLADIEELTGEPVELFAGSPWLIISRALAGAMFLQHEHISETASEAVPHGTTGRELEAWADDFDLERKSSSKATGQISISGIVGSVVPVDAVLQTNSGVRFKVTAGLTLAGGDILSVEALTAGAAGNLAHGMQLSFVAAHAGVDASGPVLAPGFSGGADEEKDPRLLERVLDHLREPPHGGNKADYRRWAKEVPGVTRAWVYPGEQGKGTVVIRFMMDDVRAINKGIPQGTGSPDYSGDQALVRDHIEVLRPVTGERFYEAPTPKLLNVTIQGLSPDTPEIRATVIAELAAMVERDGEPGGTLQHSRIGEAVSVATGEHHHTVTDPPGNVDHGVGEIPVMGDVVFVDA